MSSFMIFARTKQDFDFPLHYHEEFELNLVLNAKGAQRIVGDHIDTIEAEELVLIGPNLNHGWFNHECKSKEITEITIFRNMRTLSDTTFHKGLFTHNSRRIEGDLLQMRV